MQDSKVYTGLWVKIINLDEAKKIITADKYHTVREVGVEGVVLNNIPRHEGDAWFIQHRNSNVVGAYLFTEFEPI